MKYIIALVAAFATANAVKVEAEEPTHRPPHEDGPYKDYYVNPKYVEPGYT